MNPRKVTAGVAAATLALGSIGVYEARKDVTPANAAAKRSRPMKPVQFMNSIRKYEQNLHMNPEMGRGINMNYTRGVLAETQLVIRGRCNPNNPYVPGMKAYVDTATKRTDIFCGDQYPKDVNPHPSYLGENGVVSFSKLLNGLGNKGAVSGNVPIEKVGTTKKIVASKSRATIIYANDTEGTGRSLKKLVLAQRHAPGGRVLVRLGWFRAK